MSGVFGEARAFNQDLASVGLSKAPHGHEWMFADANAFNQRHRLIGWTDA